MGVGILPGSTGWGRRQIGGVLAVALLVLPGSTHSDIGSTKHNLTRKGGPAVDTQDQNATCVFCHTPVAVLNELDSPGVLPKWNRSVSVAPSFAIYDHIGRASRDGDVFVGSSSMACLSCHDGSQAPNIVKDSYNHPFGVPYKGQVTEITLAENGIPGVTKLPPLPLYSSVPSDLSHDFRPAVVSKIDNRQVWWVPAGGVLGRIRRTKNDLPLYGHEVEARGEMVPFVECASCHDPHNDSDAFLRVGRGGSRLCLTCHDK